jgi:hypothetical protein
LRTFALSPLDHYLTNPHKFWSRWSGSNRQPAVYKTAALPLSYTGAATNATRRRRSPSIVARVLACQLAPQSPLRGYAPEADWPSPDFALSTRGCDTLLASVSSFLLVPVPRHVGLMAIHGSASHGARGDRAADTSSQPLVYPRLTATDAHSRLGVVAPAATRCLARTDGRHSCPADRAGYLLVARLPRILYAYTVRVYCT